MSGKDKRIVGPMSNGVKMWANLPYSTKKSTHCSTNFRAQSTSRHSVTNMRIQRCQINERLRSSIIHNIMHCKATWRDVIYEITEILSRSYLPERCGNGFWWVPCIVPAQPCPCEEGEVTSGMWRIWRIWRPYHVHTIGCCYGDGLEGFSIFSDI